MTSRSRSGMTLIELMLVVVVVGIVTAAVLPRIARSREVDHGEECRLGHRR